MSFTLPPRARAAPVRPRFDLCLDLGNCREFLGLLALGGDRLVQLVFHVMFQRLCLGLMVHETDGSRAPETRDKGSSINLHVTSQYGQRKGYADRLQVSTQKDRKPPGATNGGRCSSKPIP
jgi:hypothetical protein